MAKKLTIRNRYDNWVKPFRRVVTKAKVACRFCESATMKKYSGAPYTQAWKNHKNEYMIDSGAEAVLLTTTAGPAGTAYICMDCAKALLGNLAEAIQEPT